MLLLSVAFLYPQSAVAWGARAHSLSAQVTETYLTPEAKAQVAELIAPKKSLGDIASWADGYSRTNKKTRGWHYVNVPISQNAYQARYCPRSGCVVSKIADFQAVLADPNASFKDKQFALKFLVHAVQDLHQPLHVGDNGDLGGNRQRVVFNAENSNLHRVWDSGMMHFTGMSNKQWLAAIDTLAAAHVNDWARGSAEDWATESILLSQQAYRLPGESKIMPANAYLPDAYAEQFLPLMTERLAQASIRLAYILNVTLTDSSASSH